MSEFKRSEQPEDGDERSITLGWLAFHRDALQAKCEGLTVEQLVHRSAEPSHLSLLGLVRHMAEMEHAYGSWPWERTLSSSGSGVRTMTARRTTSTAPGATLTSRTRVGWTSDRTPTLLSRGARISACSVR